MRTQFVLNFSSVQHDQKTRRQTTENERATIDQEYVLVRLLYLLLLPRYRIHVPIAHTQQYVAGIWIGSRERPDTNTRKCRAPLSPHAHSWGRSFAIMDMVALIVHTLMVDKARNNCHRKTDAHTNTQTHLHVYARPTQLSQIYKMHLKRTGQHTHTHHNRQCTATYVHQFCGVF